MSIRFAHEGYPFIGVFFIGAALTAFLAIWLAAIFLVVALFMMYFFRDPDRAVPPGEGCIISPADGKLILIQRVFEDKLLMCETKMISIFMSPLDVHVNRAPYGGTVECVVHTPGKFFSAFRQEAFLQNENIAMVLSTQYGRLMVRQVAGFLARRAVCRVKPGAVLKKGERYGIIKFSSRLDIFLPAGAEIVVALGDRVRAGETVLGMIPADRKVIEDREAHGST